MGNPCQRRLVRSRGRRRVLTLRIAINTLRHAEATARQARKDLREDRRIDFQQQVILSVATDYEDLARGGPVTTEMIAAKARVLPPDMLPLMRALWSYRCRLQTGSGWRSWPPRWR